MGNEPFATFRREVVVTHSATAGTRVNDLAAASVDRDVIYAHAVCGEQHEVALAESSKDCRNGLANRGLLARCARQLNAMLTEYVLHESRTVESVRCVAA